MQTSGANDKKLIKTEMTISLQNSFIIFTPAVLYFVL
jgi:hypothetical protein